MPPRTSRHDDRHAETDSYDRYSHVKTESGDIIYDTECEDAWIQADESAGLDEWR